MSTRYQTRRQSRIERATRSALVSRIVSFLLQAGGVCLFAFLFGWVILNWLSGCGEAFAQADGSYVQGECIMHPWRD